MADEIEIGGQLYVIGELGAVAQFNILRRVLSVFGPVLEARRAGTGGADADFAKAFLAAPDGDTESLILNCLSIVSRREPDGSVTPLVAGGQVIDSVTAPLMLELIGAVLTRAAAKNDAAVSPVRLQAADLARMH